MKVCCDDSSDSLIQPLIFTIVYADPDFAGKRLGENNPQLISWHWPGDDESILLIVASIVDTTILSIVDAAIGSPPDPSYKIRELCCCREQPH